MKVRQVGGKSVAGITGPLGDKQAKGISKVSFVEEMKRVEEKQIKQELKEILNDIDNLGKNMAEHRNVEDLQEYKNKVKDFLATSLKKIYKLKEDMSFDRRGRHRIYSLVEKVDKELEELTDMFMDKQQDKLALVAKVDEIRGLLIDVYM